MAVLPDYEKGKPIFIDISLQEILPFINWKMLFHAWKITGTYLDSFPFGKDKNTFISYFKTLDISERTKAEEAYQLYDVANEILSELITGKKFDAKAVIRFEPVSSDFKNIYINQKTFPMLRQQREGTDFLCCTDFIDPQNSLIGLFAVTAGNYLQTYAHNLEEKGDIYKSLIIQSLSDRIAEASSEWLQNFVSVNYFPVNIRPAWGYPMLPDQSLILETKELLPYEKIGIKLTENGAMFPPSSISGLYFSNLKAKYFMVGEIGEDQIKDYAQRRGISVERVKSLLRQL